MLSEENRAAVEKARRENAEMTPEVALRSAAFLREAKPKLRNQRQREIAEEMAQRFDERAVGERC